MCASHSCELPDSLTGQLQITGTTGLLTGFVTSKTSYVTRHMCHTPKRFELIFILKHNFVEYCSRMIPRMLLKGRRHEPCRQWPLPPQEVHGLRRQNLHVNRNEKLRARLAAGIANTCGYFRRE